jgi:1-acyl-sn-glycerol-3-phosphate acyltransferase
MIREEPLRYLGFAFYTVCRSLASAATISLTGVRHFNVPDLSRLGGAVIASNHQSYLDPVLVGMPFLERVDYLAREGLFRVPGFGQLIRAVGSHPVRRGAVDSAALKTVLRVLRSGRPLLMFPEGTRTRDGSLGRFSPGVGAIAARVGAPVVPVCIEGAFRCWPRTRLVPVPARTAVAFGEPIRPERTDDRALSAALREQIAELQIFLRRYLRREGCGVPRGTRRTD